MLKPIDIHNAEFKRSFKGYSEEEVDTFLEKVVTEYENLFRENKKLKDEIERLQQELKKLKNKEEDIYGLITLTKEAVTEAKAVATEQGQSIIDDANLKAKVIMDEAKWKANQSLKESQTELEQVKGRIGDFIRTEKQFKRRMRQLMETFWAMIEEIDDYADKHDEESKIEPENKLDETKVYTDLTEKELAATDTDKSEASDD